MKKIFCFAYLIFQLQINLIIAQDQWDNLNSCLTINAIAQEMDTLWIGTNEGLVKLNKATGEFKHINTTNSKLQDNVIYKIIVDDNNYKWLGTNNGLVKFRGDNWRLYNKSNCDIKHSRIYSLAYEKGKGLWIGGATEGITFYDGESWLNYNTNNSQIPRNWIKSIVVAQDGIKWIGTSGGGLAKFDGYSWTIYDQINSGLPNNVINAIAIDSLKNIWISSYRFVSRFDGVEWQHWKSDYSEDNINSLICDRQGTIWAGYFAGGISYFTDNNWEVYNYQNSDLPHSEISTIWIDELQNKWIGTLGKGLWKFDNTNWINQQTGNSELPGNWVYSIKVNDSNEKWFSTSEGISKLNENTWTHYNSENTGINNFFTIKLCVKGNSIFGSNEDGIFKFENTKWSLIQFPDEFKPVYVNDILIEDEIIWIATYNKGLIKYEEETWSFSDSNSSIPSENVETVFIDGKKITWISNSDGLYKYENGLWIFISEISVRKIIEDRNNNLWIGGKTGGLYYYDGHKLTNFNLKNSDLPDNNVLDIAINDSDNLWIGTLKGLVKFDGENWQIFTIENSKLLSNVIQVLEIDKEGNLWIGTDAGIAVYNETGIVSVEDHIIANGGEIPHGFYLSQNYPNPFNPETKIEYELRKDSNVNISVFDIQGKLIKTLVNKYHSAGFYKIDFKADGLSSGIYLYSLNVDGKIKTKKMILIK